MYILLLIIFSSFLLCYAYYVWAKKKQIIDRPNERSSHTHTPVRGMGIVFCVLLFPLYFIFPTNWNLFLGLQVAGIIGYLDDRFTIKSNIRLTLYIFSLILAGFQYYTNSELAPFWLLPVILVGVGIINTINFMDGINGITGYYIIVFIVSVLLNSYTNWIEFDRLTPLEYGLCVALIFLVSFGFFNYRNQALAFLGDSGSVSLGLLVVLTLINLGINEKGWSVLSLVVVYGVDSVGTIFIRLLRRENIFEAHRNHLYQDLVHIRGWGHHKVALTYAVLQIIINTLYFNSEENGSMLFFVCLIVLIMVYVIVKHYLGQLKFLSRND
ncbi:MAG: hypothetical protein R3A43_04205 [Bacteroidia bacterium]